MEFVEVQPGDVARIEIVRELFLEYQHSIGVDLCFQNFEEELASLPGKYSPPMGLLLLVFDGARPVACGALRRLEDGVCEIKRIYVRPEARRRGLARTISERLLEFAREAGYRTVRLDTMVRMIGAKELYQQLGFAETGPYRYNPEPDVVYMELALDG